MSPTSTGSAVYQATAESLQSTFHEQVVEHIFIAELLQEAWLRYNKVVEVMRSEVDAYGYDLVLECAGVVRHVQLKASRHDAKTDSHNISLALGAKPSGCVVWIKREDLSRQLAGKRGHAGNYRFKLSYLFFGNPPGLRLPDLLAKKAPDQPIFREVRQTRYTRDSQRSLRPSQRAVRDTHFRPRGSTGMTMADLFVYLFMTLTETQHYIRQQAIRYRAADEEWEYEEIELAAFRVILRFALAEGWHGDPATVNKTLYGVDYDDEAEEDDEHTTWHYMHLLLEEFEAQQAAGQLPPQTAALFTFWQTEFWGPAAADD